MSEWLFLSKNNEDEYVNLLARSAGYEPTDSDYFDYHYDCIIDGKKLVLRGILKHKIMHRCLADKVDFLYIDSGYFGNQVSSRNRWGTKFWHRIVPNDLQHNDIVDRPGDRWEKLGINLDKRRLGRRIIVAAPDDKPCRYYGIDREQWITDTVSKIKEHTDRPIVVRERAPKRIDRVTVDPLERVLADDVHALVTFNSNAAVESIIHGVPAFVLAPSHAAAPVANRDLSRIESPSWPSDTQRRAWVHHLAYCQFHVHELKDGTAWRMLTT